MAQKWHVGKDGQPHVCTAQGACPLGGDAAHHYASKNDCYKAIEKQAEANYVKSSGSLKKALRFQKKYEDWKDEDPEINKIISQGLKGHKFTMMPTRDGERELMPRKMLRQSKATKAMTDKLRDNYYVHSRRMEALAGDKPNTALACSYRSMDNIDADMELLKGRLRETMAMDHVNNNTTIGDVAYTNGRSDTAMYVNTAVSFDKEALAADMAAAGYQMSDVQDSKTSMSMSAVRSFVNSQADADLGIKPGTKGAPAKRAEYLENSGLFQTTTTYTPDASSVDKIAHDNQEAVIGRQFSKEDVDGMLSSGQVRAALCELGYQKMGVQADINRGESRLRSAGGSDANAMFRASSDKKAGSAFADEKMEGLRYKARATKSLVDEGKAKEWIKAHGGDPSSSEFYSTRSSVSMDKLSAFHEQHPEISVYKYARPVHRVSFRNLESGAGREESRIAAREV